MKRLLTAVAAVASLGAADFTYSEKSEVTGGAMKGMMDMVRRMSPEAAGGMNAVHKISGNKMATENGRTSTIIDLDAETMTTIDQGKKEYSTITFAEMAAAMKAMADRMAQMRGQKPAAAAGQMDWKVDAQTPGDTRQVAGVTAKHAVLTMTSSSADPKTGAQGVSSIQMDLWMASVPGWQVYRDFSAQMAQKMNFGGAMSGMLMQAGPAAMDGMREAAKKMAQMEGLKLYGVVRMSGSGGSGMPSMPPPGASQQQGAPAGQPSADARDEAVKSALGRFGGLGGRLGRKKNEQPAQTAPPPAATPEAPAAAPTSSGEGTLMEITSEVTSFSSDPVSPATFQIPAGFKQVEHPMKRMSRQ